MWFFFLMMARLKRCGASWLKLGMTNQKKMTDLFTDLNVFQACSNAVVTLIIDLSASTSLHCFF